MFSHTNISATSTDSEILSVVEAKKARMAKRLLDGEYVPVDEIARFAIDLAGVTGEARALLMIRDGMKYETASRDKIAEHLTREVLNGPDDKWSGRSNDVRRAEYEGFLTVARRFARGF